MKENNEKLFLKFSQENCRDLPWQLPGVNTDSKAPKEKKKSHCSIVLLQLDDIEKMFQLGMGSSKSVPVCFSASSQMESNLTETWRVALDEINTCGRLPFSFC